MALRKSYRLACDFCRVLGPHAGGEAEAVREAASCPRRITRVHRSYYGNEVHACGNCLRTNDEARRWAADEVVIDG